MKNNNITGYTLLIAGLMLTASCTKNFVSINTNPTTFNVSNFNPNTLLTTVELRSGSSMTEVWRGNLPLASVMMQVFSTTSGLWVGDKYMENVEYMNSYCTMAYPDQVKPVVELVEFTNDKPEYANLHQIARLMKAWIFQRITDQYGDIPYSEAGLAYHESILYPKYGKQEAIYTDLLKEIEEATLALDPAGTKPTGDMIYSGDIAKWQRFGYSLLLRAGMRLVKVNDALAKSTVMKVLGKTMNGIADNTLVKGSGVLGQAAINNPNSTILLGDGGAQEHFYTKWSKTYIDFLKNNNDPRLTRVARVNVWTSNPLSLAPSGNANGSAALQKGLPNGKNASVNNDGYSIYYDPSWSGAILDAAGFNSYSSINLEMMQRTAPTFLLSYSESEFLLAEAVARWGSTYGGDAATHYNNGVRAAMTSLSQFNTTLTIPDAEVNAYLTANPYVAANGLAMINTQYWAETGTVLNFYETWINWRRTGLPALVQINYPGNVTGGTIPRRHIYPLAEASTNAANLNSAISALSGGDKMTSRVWWDK